MPIFEYKGRNRQTGTPVNDKITAESEKDAVKILLDRGITPLSLKETVDKSNKNKLKTSSSAGGFFSLSNVSRKDIIIFCKQMHGLTHAGIPVNLAILKSAEMVTNSQLRKVLNEIGDKVSAGMPLAKCLSQYPNIFSGLFTKTVEAGEMSGELEETFKELSKYLDFEQQSSDRFKSAMRYPVIVMLTLIIAIVVLAVFVIPRFQMLYRSLGVTMPLPTRIILGASDFIVKEWKLITGILFCMYLSIKLYISTKKGRYVWDYLLMSIPPIGSIVYRAYMARLSRLFTIVFRSGLSLVDTLNMVASALDNSYISYHMNKIATEVSEGKTFTNSAADSKLFPPFIMQMIQVGEQTGMLEEMLAYGAEHYEREVDFDIQRLEDILTPITLVVLGAMLLVVALGVFLPMWSAIQA